MGAFSISVLLIAIVTVSSKPIGIQIVERTADFEVPSVIEYVANSKEVIVNSTEDTNSTFISMRNTIRPGMVVTSYSVELTPNVASGSFDGRVLAEVSITDVTTRDQSTKFHVGDDLQINSVRYSLIGGTNYIDASFSIDDGILEIETDFEATLYTFVFEYTGSLEMYGKGFYVGHYDNANYLGMNLHPTHARRVFPCIDEPSEVTVISFKIDTEDYTNFIANSMLEDGSDNQFRALPGPPHSWGLLAHNFVILNIATTDVVLYGRSGVSGQESPASLAINSIYNNLNEWTNKRYVEILVDQDGRLNVMALPDVSRDWHALSTVGIWEPYVLMQPLHSERQRLLSMQKISEAIAKQWFGYVVFPETWQFEWVVSGLATYAGYEMLRIFQTNPLGFDDTLLDINTLFVTEVIQESLLRDAYTRANVLEPDNDLLEEDEIRDHVFGLQKFKAPALMRMWRIVLADENNDIIQVAGQALLARRSLDTVSSLNFIEALNSFMLSNNNGRVDDIEDYITPWTKNTGYPLLHVGLRQGGMLLTPDTFSFSLQNHVSYLVPVTYTTSINPDFSNIYPIMMIDTITTLNLALGDDDWILFNIQGQGYYRVNYDDELWDRIIDALDDPDRREQIHPLNRATLVDDALNLARADRLDYDVAFRVVLTMEHETEYAVWKAFVRNMDFLKKRLLAMLDDDEDLDPDIYLRMVRRTIGAVENQLGFYPEINLNEPAMTSLTRGLVMEHACKANYQPCIAAAVDWFYDPNSNEPTVNPNIPHEIRPAVFCTMVREGDGNVRDALYARLEIEPVQYERVVILQSLACSQDSQFINSLLDETIAGNSPYGPEERVKIFAAVAESSFGNAMLAVNFISRRTAEIRNMYGGPEKLEELIYILADNIAGGDLENDFDRWVLSQNNNLDDSQMAAEHALAHVQENLLWENSHLDYVYEWIDENDASTMVLSVAALCISLMVGFLNH